MILRFILILIDLWFGLRGQYAAAAAAAKSLQLCPTLCNPIDGSPPGSPVPRILQARVLEWVAIAFSSLYSRYTERPSHMLGELLWNSVMKSFVSLNCLKLFWDICYNIIKIHLWSTSELKSLHPLVMVGLGTFCKAATLLNNCVGLWS